MLVKEQQWYYLIHIWEDKRIHTFLKGISLKVNVIIWLEFKIAYFKAKVQHHTGDYLFKDFNIVEDGVKAALVEPFEKL